MKERFKMWWYQEANYPDGSILTGRELATHIGACFAMLVVSPAVCLFSLKYLATMLLG
jgi:hypothetical protein